MSFGTLAEATGFARTRQEMLDALRIMAATDLTLAYDEAIATVSAMKSILDAFDLDPDGRTVECQP